MKHITSGNNNRVRSVEAEFGKCVFENFLFLSLCSTHSAFATILNFSLHYIVEQEKRQRTSAPLARRNRTKVRARVFRTNHQKVLNEDRKNPLIVDVLCSAEQGSCYTANFIYALSGFSFGTITGLYFAPTIL